ncbi:MAG TPA: isochorismatase family cysteine hydrolase [Reyranella sp.]|nr:isochorismatase family cysteine hydrolase [Reyranella sp.]
MNLAATALLAIDLQNEYRTGAAWPVDGYEAVLDNAARLMDAARAAGILVIHAQAWVKPEERKGYARQEEILTEEFRSAVAGSSGADICAEVAPLPSDIVIHKHWPSVFRRTDLARRLAEHGIENLMVAGVLTDSCVTESVFDAVYQGFRVWLVKDACGSMSEAMHRTGMLDMANRLYGGGILRMPQALKALAGQPFDGWRCTRPVEFTYTLETVDRLYEAL